MAKFWFSNGLGDLEVYPATRMAKAMASLSPRPWRSGREKLVFVLAGAPVASPQKGYSKKDWSIWRGGGPFMLEDSAARLTFVVRKPRHT